MGNVRTVQPLVFHHIMDRVTAAGWQVTQHGDELEVLLAQPRDLDHGALAGAINSALATQGVQPPRIKVREVASIPRTALGKAPLIVRESVAQPRANVATSTAACVPRLS